MAITSSAMDVRKIARSVWERFLKVYSTALKAEQDPTAENIIALRMVCYDSHMYFQSIASQGITVAILNPALTSIYDLDNASVDLSSIVSLYTTIIPGFLTYCGTNQAKLLNGSFDGAKISYPTLSSQDEQSFLTEIEKITDEFI